MLRTKPTLNAQTEHCCVYAETQSTGLNTPDPPPKRRSFASICWRHQESRYHHMSPNMAQRLPLAKFLRLAGDAVPKLRHFQISC